MDTQATARIPQPFCDMPDPRRNNRRHPLIDIITIALFAIICGAEDWEAVALYGRCKFDWLKTFLKLPHGIPSHDTFNDVFNHLDPDAFESRFQAWMATLVQLSAGKLVAIDGKSIRRSFEHGWDKSGMAHMVSAFVQANHMVFAQVEAGGPGQELSAIERLLSMLDLNGAVVTIDALGCNPNIAGLILEKNGHYILPVKGNQETLQAKLSRAMDEAILENFADIKHDRFEQIDGDHGRIETRKLWVCWDVKDLLGEELAGQWPGLKTLIAIERTRELNGKTSRERHYYISSLNRRTKAKGLADYIRGHWSIENNLHWQLDVSFNEDQRRVRKGHGAENLSRLTRTALNLLKRESTAKCGIANKRKNCGWSNDYLLKVVLA
jgi:predicted transposase YbfD/YdcC